MNELGNTPADKNYRPSGISKAEERALEAYPIHPTLPNEVKDYIAAEQQAYRKGYEQAEKDIISLIESRISEIIGDAQPKPTLRAELQELIERIKEAKR